MVIFWGGLGRVPFEVRVEGEEGGGEGAGRGDEAGEGAE